MADNPDAAAEALSRAQERWQRAVRAMEEFERRYDSLSGRWDEYRALRDELSAAGYALRQARDA